ncbi:AAA family ATPase [Lachnotalea glycerini]|uniref:AAA family ATPase n=1 Tax=Lachnotalea glycerini TaxID=1763509 RepID=A0A371JBN8_9FIRM|nr:AAA family ATPase [Lachnotalea glycerini]RDY30133.1 AAA family ATPase [Lachnotalea glycerini]
MANLDQIKQFNDGYIFPQTYDETYLATQYISAHMLEVPENVISKLQEKIEEKGLYFGDSELIREIVVGLIKGNIILQGPPGTGKTTLAKIVCEVFNVGYDETTAAAEWTTFDTIGGLQPSTNAAGSEIMVGKMGYVTRSVFNCCNTVLKKQHYQGDKQASWLILDELNRCEIDKAFGDLFTVFGSDGLAESRAINLWFENDDNKKKIYMPNTFRIIGAMNNIDKNYVFDISQGLSRRFTFINVLPPTEELFDNEIANAKKISKNRVINKLSYYSGTKIDTNLMDKIDADFVADDTERVLVDILKHIRYLHDDDDSYLGLSVGTAQIIDLYENIFLSAIIDEYYSATDKKSLMQKIVDNSLCTRIIPQMDGFDYIRLNNFYDEINRKTDYKFLKKTLSEIKKFNR